jgi:NhaA family Na+:H+ antiporter
MPLQRLVARFTHAELDADLAWADVLGLALLAGIGFTVSLLIGELAFGAGTERDEHVKVGVLAGSLLAAALAAVVLRARNRIYRRVCELEAVDADHDGVPDVYRHRRLSADPPVSARRSSRRQRPETAPRYHPRRSRRR